MLERPVLKAGWTRARFDQIAMQINDRVDNPAESGVDRYVGLEHLDPDSLRIRRWGEPSDVESTKLRFQPGDIIFGKRRVYQRKISVADFEGICSAHAMVLRAKPGAVLPEFLPFFMQSDLFMERALSISVGSLSPTINWKAIAAEEFLLPPIQEQARQVDTLMAFDDAIFAAESSRKAALVVWRALSKEEFSSRAGRGSKLADHYSIESGQVDPKADVFADLPLVGPNHVESVTGVFLGAETARVQAAISGKYLFGPGAVIYSKIRPELRKAMLADFRGLCSADMYPLVSGPTMMPEYLLDLVLSDAFSAFAISCSMRTGMPKMNREQLDQFLFDLPTVTHQSNYVAAANGVKKTVTDFAVRSLRLLDMKKSILNGVSSDDI